MNIHVNQQWMPANQKPFWKFLSIYMDFNMEISWSPCLFEYVLLNPLRPSDAYMHKKITSIGSDNGLSPGGRQAIIWTNIVNSNLRNKHQSNLERNLFIQENAFENVVYEMVPILSWPQYVNRLPLALWVMSFSFPNDAPSSPSGFRVIY